MSKAEQAIENDKLHLVSTSEAIRADADREHRQTNEVPLASAAPSSDEKVWNPDNPDFVLVSQPAILMYLNTQRQVVIRQEQLWNEEDDSYIYISVENIDLIIARLQSLKADAKAGA